MGHSKGLAPRFSPALNDIGIISSRSSNCRCRRLFFGVPNLNLFSLQLVGVAVRLVSYIRAICDRCTLYTSKMSKEGKVQLTGVEVAKHNSKDDCWVIVHVSHFPCLSKPPVYPIIY